MIYSHSAHQELSCVPHFCVSETNISWDMAKILRFLGLFGKVEAKDSSLTFNDFIYVLDSMFLVH